MSQQAVDVGSAANDGTGDDPRTSFTKLNANDAELYASVASLTGAVAADGAAIAALGVDLAALDSTVDAQAVTVTALGASLAALQGTVAGQAVTVTALGVDLTALQGTVAAQAVTVTALGASLTALQGVVTSEQAVVDAIGGDITALQTDVSALQLDMTAVEAAVAAIAPANGPSGRVQYSDGAGGFLSLTGFTFDPTTKIFSAPRAAMADTASAGSGSLAGSALTLSQLWNTTGAPVGIDFTITDTASAAGALAMRIRGGPSGTTNLLSLTKLGILSSSYGVDSWSITNNNGYSTTLTALYDLELNSTSGAVQVKSTGAVAGTQYMLLRRTGLLFGRDVASPNIGQMVQAGDVAATGFSITGQAALPSAVTNLVGGNVTLTGGSGASGSAGAAHGGNLILRGGAKYGTGHIGFIVMDNLPTSASGLSTGALWNNGGVLNIA